VEELLVGAQYRQTRNAKVRRETATRWNPLTGTQPAVEDGAAESFIDLSVDGYTDVPVDGQVQSGHAEFHVNGDGENTSLSNIR
jgi:hypothetical protein